MALPEELGKYPADGETARREKRFYKLTDGAAVKMISGRKTPALLNVWASNDVVSFGNIKILSGGAGPQQTEYDSHPGDAVFYVLSGPATFYLPDTKDTYDVQEGDFMYLPDNTRYKIINYTAKTIKCVFAVAPKL